MKSTLQTIPVKSLKLDLENPRLYHDRMVAGKELLTDSALEEIIANEGA